MKSLLRADVRQRILAPLTFLSVTILSALVAKADANITEGPTGLTTTVPGVTITGSQDDWTVTAPAGLVFNFVIGGTQITLGEPQVETQVESFFNLLTGIQPASNGTFTSFTWQSESLASVPDNTSGYDGNTGSINLGGVDVPNESIVLQDTGDAPAGTGVPDTSSMLLLVGLGFLGMGLLARSGALARAIQIA
jgi:hypothetical protein